MIRSLRASVFLLSFMLCQSVHAFLVPPFTPNVVDESRTLSYGTIERINQTIDVLQKQDKVFPAVLVVSSLQGDSVEDAAEAVFKKWALGKSGKDNGVLILVSLNDRKMRIEVGYGLEGDITDYHAGDIIEDIMVPAFRRGDYETGIVDALKRIGMIANGEYVENPSPIRPAQNDFDSVTFFFRLYAWIALFIAIPALILIVSFILAFILRPEPFQKMRETKFPGYGFPVVLFLFLNPGIFIVLFPSVFIGDDEIIWIMNILGAVFGIGAILRAAFYAANMFSIERYNKKLEKDRIRRTVSFSSSSSSSGGSYSSSSRSSSSSSSSRSSSSGGGRSGGGGASGSW